MHLLQIALYLVMEAAGFWMIKPAYVKYLLGRRCDGNGVSRYSVILRTDRRHVLGVPLILTGGKYKSCIRHASSIDVGRCCPDVWISAPVLKFPSAF